jgi:hypothetical protein
MLTRYPTQAVTIRIPANDPKAPRKYPSTMLDIMVRIEPQIISKKSNIFNSSFAKKFN